jgi:glycosyltransferase involved in cell wall biosynthesis
MIRVIAYTGGWNAPSRVFRVQYYQQPLRTFGIDVKECASAAGVYPPERRWLRPAWAVWNVVDRAPDVLRSLRHDLVFFQREMLSTYVTWEPLTKKPRLFDVDDAIWDHRRGSFAQRIAGICDRVICGNTFLAAQFSRWNANVSILPTPVNIKVFYPATDVSNHHRPIIGWMGLMSGFKHLYSIEGALARVLRGHPDVVFRVVSSGRPVFRLIPPEQFEWIPWTQENEARTVREMTIGIMPLDDTVFSRGKCSYKMLLYMASGLPVVVSPVGMNAEVLAKGNIGIGARNEKTWIESLTELLRNESLRSQMGKTGRQVVQDHFSVEVLAPQLARIISSSSVKTDGNSTKN